MEDRRLIRVLVADDHPVYRAGIIRALEEHDELELIAEAHDGRTALAKIRALRPDVALLDARMPQLGALEVLEALAEEEDSPTRVLILSAYAEPQLVHGALTRGAAGYLSKEAEGEEISRAVVTAAQGEKVVSTRLLAGVLAEIGRHGRSEREARADRPSLTRREREVLSLVAEGRTAREIARELYLSYATVKTHLHNIYDKLGVSDRAGAVSVALRRRLLE